MATLLAIPEQQRTNGYLSGSNLERGYGRVTLL